MARCPNKPAPAPARAHYLDRHHLADLVRLWQATEKMTDDLGRALLAIAGGVWDRYHFTADREEFCQEVALHLVGTPLKKCDPAQHVFNYFTTCSIRYGQKLRDKANGERRRFKDYARHLVDMREEIPERE